MLGEAQVGLASLRFGAPPQEDEPNRDSEVFMRLDILDSGVVLALSPRVPRMLRAQRMCSANVG